MSKLKIGINKGLGDRLILIFLIVILEVRKNLE